MSVSRSVCLFSSRLDCASALLACVSFLFFADYILILAFLALALTLSPLTLSLSLSLSHSLSLTLSLSLSLSLSPPRSPSGFVFGDFFCVDRLWFHCCFQQPALIPPSVTMTQLTEEELELQKKYAILRKHKKILSDLKKQRKESMKSSNADGANKVRVSVVVLWAILCESTEHVYSHAFSFRCRPLRRRLLRRNRSSRLRRHLRPPPPPIHRRRGPPEV